MTRSSSTARAPTACRAWPSTASSSGGGIATCGATPEGCWSGKRPDCRWRGAGPQSSERLADAAVRGMEGNALPAPSLDADPWEDPPRQHAARQPPVELDPAGDTARLVDGPYPQRI